MVDENGSPVWLPYPKATFLATSVNILNEMKRHSRQKKTPAIELEHVGLKVSDKQER